MHPIVAIAKENRIKYQLLHFKGIKSSHENVGFPLLPLFISNCLNKCISLDMVGYISILAYLKYN